MSTNIVEFFRKNDAKILVVLALVLVGFVCFRAGQSHQKSQQSSQLSVSINPIAAANPAEQNVKTLGDTLARKGIEVGDLASQKQQVENPEIASQECQLVGSKNSDKYHLPGCDNAKKIKAGNLVCFSSAQDAQDKGYKPAKCCH